MAKGPGSNDDIMESSFTPAEERPSGRETKTPNRKRDASQEASSLSRETSSATRGKPSPPRAFEKDQCPDVAKASRQCGFLRLEEMKTSRASDYQVVREDMMLYNWQKMTLSVLTVDGIEESQDIRQPLARILCCASSALVKDNKVFASVSTSRSYVLQVFDLHTGQLLEDIDSNLLSGQSRILLGSHQHRIYVADYGGRHIFEMYPNYQLRKVAEVRKGITNFWVEHQDESSFHCTYTQKHNRITATYLRLKTRCLDYRLQYHNFLDHMIVGCRAGNSYLLPKERSGVVIVYRDGESCEFHLSEKIYFPYSFNYSEDLIHVLRGDGILVIDTKTKVRSMIRNTLVAQKFDEECRLMKRIITMPF